MKTIYKIAIVMAAVLAVMACRNDEHSLDPEVAVTGETLVNAEGGSIVLKLTSTASWIAEMNQEWCTVSPAEGDAGEYDLLLTVGANGSSEDRSAELTVSSGSVVYSTVILQEGGVARDALTVSHYGSSFTAPLVTGDSLSEARISWGDGSAEKDYIPGEEYEYDGEGSYDTVVSAYGIEEITVQSLKGVTSISLSETI